MGPVHPLAVQPADAAVHHHTQHANDHDAHEDDIEHEQLARPHHQVTDAFAGGQQLHGQQGGPARRQGQAYTGHERRQCGGQDQTADQQVARQAQYTGGFAQVGLGVANAYQGMQGHGHHDGLDQHHQLEGFANAEKHHEQRDPGEGRHLRQRAERREHQALGARTETQERAQYRAATDTGQQAPEQALQADGQMAP